MAELRCLQCGAVAADPAEDGLSADAGDQRYRFCMHCGATLPDASDEQSEHEDESARVAATTDQAEGSAPSDPDRSRGASVGEDEGAHLERASRTTANWAFGLGLATLVLTVLGPFALWLGLRSRRHGGGRAIVGIVLGSLGTLVLVASVAVLLWSVVAVTYEFGNTGNGFGRVAAVLDMLGTHRQREVVERIPLSGDQKEIVDLYGYPSSFVLLVDDRGVRAEGWDYFVSTGADPFLREHFEPRRLYFEDGAFVVSAPISAVSASKQLDYRPTEFDMTADEEQIRQIMGRPTEKRELDMQEYGALTVLNYRNEIMFVFRDNKPFGVMTFVKDGMEQEALP